MNAAPRRAVLAASLFAPAVARAQGGGQGGAQGAWSPTRPIRLVVAFAPGGTTDLAARLLAEPLSRRLGQQVVVDNRPGAGGNIGSDFVVRAEPDGHTLLLQTVGPGAINYQLYGPRMPYKPEDLAGISLLTRVPNAIFVTPSLPVRTLAELVALAKANPGKFNFGGGAVGTSLHMTGELLKIAAGIDITFVPFRGAGPMLQEVMAGRLEIGVDNLPTVLNHLREGRVRPLAVTTATRSPQLPDVPTTAEAGQPGLEATAWFGVAGPARLPHAVIERLNKEIEAMLAEPAIWAKFADLGGMRADLAPGGGSTPEAYDTFTRSEIEKWSETVRRSGASAE